MKEARSHGVDGVVHLVTPESRSSYFVTQALEEAGIPVLEIDAEQRRRARLGRGGVRRSRSSQFIETRVRA